MRIARLLLLTPLCLFAAYTYFFTDTFSGGISPSNWHINGTVSGGSDGLVSATSNGGSVIYMPAVPDPLGGAAVNEYEVKATLKIAASGGTFLLYSRATNDALSGRRRRASIT